MIDIIAKEYGWTAEYILDECTKRQVFAMVDAINARYTRQNEEFERKTSSKSGDSSFHDTAKMSDADFERAGVKMR